MVNLPSLLSEEMAGLRALLEDPTVRKTAHNAKYDLLVLRRAGVTLRGLDFDSMLASYVLDPSRRSHAIDALAVESLGVADDRATTNSAAREERRSPSTRCRSRRRATTRAPTATSRCGCAHLLEPRLVEHEAGAPAPRGGAAARGGARRDGVDRHHDRRALVPLAEDAVRGARVARSNSRSTRRRARSSTSPPIRSFG